MKIFKTEEEEKIEFSKEYLSVINMIVDKIHELVVSLTLNQINNMNTDNELFIAAHSYIDYLQHKFNDDSLDYEQEYHNELKRLVDIEFNKLYS